MQRAAFAGIKNLNTASFRNDSPLQMVQSRFPEKYYSMNGLGNNTQNEVNNNGEVEQNEQDMSSYQIMNNLFPLQ